MIKSDWAPLYEKLAEEYVGRLPRGEKAARVSRVRGWCGAQNALAIPSDMIAVAFLGRDARHEHR